MAACACCQLTTRAPSDRLCGNEQPSLRARPTWTLKHEILIRFLRHVTSVLNAAGIQPPLVDLDAPPLADHTLRYSYQVILDPVDEKHIKGVISEARKVAESGSPGTGGKAVSVSPRRIPGEMATQG